MSAGTTGADLQAIADRVVERAQPGEQLEAFVARGGETEVRVYQGDVEHFVAAQSEGVGIRVIKDGRTGFAYAGTLDDSAVDEVLAEARDNVEFGTVDEYASLAEPDGVPMTEQTLWNESLADFAPDRKIDLAKELEKLSSGSGRRVDDRDPPVRAGERLLRLGLHPGRRRRRRRRRDPDRVRLLGRPLAGGVRPRARRPRGG